MTVPRSAVLVAFVIALCGLFGIASVQMLVAAPPKSGDKKTKSRSSRSKSSKKKSGDRPFKKGPREKEFADAVGEEYRVKPTDHFIVLTNADEAIVKDFLPRLEKTYDSVHRFVDQVGVKIKYPKEKLPVLFCHDFDEYSARCKQFTGQPAPGEAAGLYWREPLNFSLFYDMSQVSFIKETTAKAEQLKQDAARTPDRNAKQAKLREANWYINRIAIYQQEQNRSVVQHEVAHQLLFNLQFHKADVDNPQWFVEGMATLFEPPPGKTGAGFNVINQSRLGEIRDALVVMKTDDLKNFISRTRTGMLSSQGYAQSWALCYYLVKRKSKELPKYVELIKKRPVDKVLSAKENLADFEKCFGKVNDMFTKKFTNYITKLPFMPPQ